MKQEKLCNLEPGSTFKLGGFEWTKLRDDIDTVRPVLRLKPDILVCVNRKDETFMQDMKITDFDECLKTGSIGFLETIINKTTTELASRCKL